MTLVGRFEETAARIFEAAEAASQADSNPTEMTILVNATGGIRLVADSDWPLDSLAAYHGAQMAYRVKQQRNVIRMEGREGNRKCVFESTKMAAVARELLGPTRALLPAGNALTLRAVLG